MCLAIPGKIERLEMGSDIKMGVVAFGGVTRSVCLDLVPEAKVGDYVLVHVGFALSRLDAVEAQETLRLLAQMGAIEDGVR